MFDSGILDVAIGITFTFLLVSTLCAAIREGLEAWLKTRATFLEYALREMLNDRDGKGMTSMLFGHPLMRGLFKGDYVPRNSAKPSSLQSGGDLPSYIPARSFAAAILDITARGPTLTAAIDPAPITALSLRANLANLPNATVRRAVLAAIDAGADDLEKIRKNLENWFEGAMDRVSGWYKRATQKFILGIALVVSCGLNLNTITIADALYRDRAIRGAAVAAASQQSGVSLGYDAVLEKFDAMRLPIGWERGWGAPRGASERRRLVERELSSSQPDFAALNDTEKARRIDQEFAKQPPDLWNDWAAPVLGLLITVLAAMLGAPFWFDVLNKVMVIRATVKPHEKSREEASEDRQSARETPARAEPVPIQFVLPNGLLPPSTPPWSAGPPAQHPENGAHGAADGCDIPIDEATPDEALPPSSGGVG